MLGLLLLQVRDVNILTLFSRAFAAAIFREMPTSFQVSTHYIHKYQLENAIQTGIVYAVMIKS